MNINQILITQIEFNKLKNEVKKAKEDKKEIVFSSEDDELNRKVIEKIEINILLINLKNRKDFQKQRNSGFNQVLAKIIKKKNMVLGINLDEIVEERNLKNKAEILARLRQNIFLCKKNKIQMRFIVKKEQNTRDIYDLKSLGLILGMPTWMTKEL